MKAITEKVWYSAANAWGRDTRACRQDFVVEESDVNRVLEHHQGFRHRTYQVRRSDVGRTRTVYTDGTDWTCWVFQGTGMKAYSQTAITGYEWRTVEEVMDFCEINPKEEGHVRALLEIRARDTSLPFRACHAANAACAQVAREPTSKPKNGAK